MRRHDHRDTREDRALELDAFVFTERHSGTAAGITGTHPDAPQLVVGSDGSDTLVGGPRNDTLVAGTGHQTMTGGGGADLFVFAKAGIDARITDFDPSLDRLEILRTDHTEARDVDAHASHGNTVIDIAGDQITLLGVTPHQLNAHDFLFHA